MEETLLWLRWLEAEDAKLVWAAAKSHAVEGGLLAVRHCSGDGASTVAVWAERDRIAAQWAKGAREAVEAILGRSGGGMPLMRLLLHVLF